MSYDNWLFYYVIICLFVISLETILVYTNLTRNFNQPRDLKTSVINASCCLLRLVVVWCWRVILSELVRLIGAL